MQCTKSYHCIVRINSRLSTCLPTRKNNNIISCDIWLEVSCVCNSFFTFDEQVDEVFKKTISTLIQTKKNTRRLWDWRKHIMALNTHYLTPSYFLWFFLALVICFLCLFLFLIFVSCFSFLLFHLFERNENQCNESQFDKKVLFFNTKQKE